MSGAEKPEIGRANENPWYCLATLYGEQPAKPDWADWDRDLAAKNRMAWNHWMASTLSNVQRADLVRHGFSESELVPLTPAEKNAFCNAFASRTGRGGVLPPSPVEVVNFNHTLFERIFIFDGFLCTKEANFRSVTFSKDAHFNSATFSGNADFSLATFAGSAHFESATFSGYADFGWVMFPGGAYFRSATFSHDAEFTSVTISIYADFSSVTFSRYADFTSVTFAGYADFGSATFSRDAKFTSVTFSGYADFSSATFSKGAAFINAQFTASALFAGVHFGTGVPDFRGAKMHEATEWHGVSWPLAPQNKNAAQAQVYAYERLKQEMERLKKHEDEQFFFRKELRARRGLIRRWSGPWLLNYAYEVSSDYGQSMGRPLFWLFVLFAIGDVLFAGTPVFNGARMPIPRAAWLSFANIFSFLPIRREIVTAEMVDGLSSAAQIVGVVQSLLGVVLLFLLGLALRSRFRMR